MKWQLILGVWACVTLLNVAILPRRYAPRVQVEILQSAPLPLIIRASGNLDAKATEIVKAEFEGPVMEKHFKEGQSVKRGKLLAIIGRKRIRLEFQAKQNALNNAKSDLSRKQRNVRLQKTLFASQAVAYAEVEDAQRELVLARQALESAQEAFKLEQIRWNSSSVRAPFDGTVVRDGLGDEKQIAAGREIVTIADISEFTVKVRVDELDIKRIAEDLPADVRIQIYPEKVFTAKVSQVGSQPDSQDSTLIPVTLLLEPSPDVVLRPKLSADVRILTGTTADLLSVPLTAIDNTDGTAKVWVLGAGSRLRQRKVTLGSANPDRVEVTEGLKTGERVCVTAEPDFSDGMRAVVGAPDKSQSKTQVLMQKAKKSNASTSGASSKKGKATPGMP